MYAHDNEVRLVGLFDDAPIGDGADGLRGTREPGRHRLAHLFETCLRLWNAVHDVVEDDVRIVREQAVDMAPQQRRFGPLDDLAGALEDDDVTLMRIRLTSSPPSALVVCL